MNKNKLDEKVKITYHLENGVIKNSMKGYAVSVNERTEIAYSIIAKYIGKDKNT